MDGASVNLDILFYTVNVLWVVYGLSLTGVLSKCSFLLKSVC